MFNPMQMMGNNNPMQMMGGNNPMQLFQIFASAQNPMFMMQQMLGGNPMFQQAMSMTQGKSPEEMKQVAINIAKQKNINMDQVKQMANQFKLQF